MNTNIGVSPQQIKSLIQEAIEARKQTYSPYSKFGVGAAVLSGGKVYRGCNIENASYGATICAERTAIFKAISEGNRTIEMIAITAGEDNYGHPCGMCRQVMREFSDPKKLIVIVAKSQEDYKTYTLEELLPNSFGPDDLSE